MIDVTNNKLIANGSAEEIKEWVVWFKCPFGISPDRAEVVAKCATNDLDPELHILPQVVAIGVKGNYEPWLR